MSIRFAKTPYMNLQARRGGKVKEKSFNFLIRAYQTVKFAELIDCIVSNHLWVGELRNCASKATVCVNANDNYPSGHIPGPLRDL